MIDGPLRYKASLDESTWGLDTDDNRLEITLVKHIPQEVEYWPSLLVGGREIDVDLIEGEKKKERKDVEEKKKSDEIYFLFVFVLIFAFLGQGPSISTDLCSRRSRPPSNSKNKEVKRLKQK